MSNLDEFWSDGPYVNIVLYIFSSHIETKHKIEENIVFVLVIALLG